MNFCGRSAFWEEKASLSGFYETAVEAEFMAKH
jgi:hypothetical protein